MDKKYLKNKEGFTPQNFSKKNLSGFTIVELLVAIGLFGVIISIAIGGFVRALRTQRQVVALINANSNVSLVIEQMSREIRTGYSFCVSQACSATNINFFDAKGNFISYNYARSADGTFGTITKQSGIGGGAIQVTADNVDIRYLTFTRLNFSNFPERITINIGLSPTAASAPVVSENVTNIQTTVSVRNI